jgi:hypothetical protein
MRTQVGAARLAVIAAVAIVTASAWAPRDVAAASLCVGGAGCYASVQAAVDAAHAGDTVTINPGTYAGGVSITTSIRLVGAGAAVTFIRGGGPVLTVGEFGAPSEPTVVISGLTITGGRTRTSAQSNDWTGTDGVVALGGGIEIPPAQDYADGATVTIRDSRISGNRVAPSATAPVGPPCPNGPCPFALASGAGIDSWGSLTLISTSVSGNLAGAASGLSDLASDTEGAGIRSWQGGLTLDHSRVTGNRAVGVAPNGRFADGGGIFVNAGTFVMRASAVDHNVVALAAAMPDSVDLGAHAGGIHLADGVTDARIVGSSISNNRLVMTNGVGTANAFSGGIHVDWGMTFSMSGTTVSGNHVRVVTTGDSTGAALADSGAGELHGKITSSRFVGNTVTARAASGFAYAIAGAAIFTGTISGSRLDANTVTVASPAGGAWGAGGALVGDEGGFTLRDTTVHDNRITVHAQDTPGAQGGGLFDAPIDNGPPGGPLTLMGVSVTGNVLAGSAGASLEGGGIYSTDVPVSLHGTIVQHNVPDQCSGFAC